jgi:hypothetical protein
MTRPAFLTSPGTWVRTPRTDQTPAEYASAVTVYQAVGSVQRAILGWLAAVCAAVLAFHGVMRWLP